MHDLDRKTCSRIAFALLGIYGLTHFALFYFDVPIGNRETLSRSLATLENLLLLMAGFFYGASAMKKNPESGDGTVTEQVRVTETKTKEEIKPVVQEVKP